MRKQPHSTEEKEETAVVVKAIFREDRDLRDPFAEIVALARTAGVRVVGKIPQRIERPNAATYLGHGKITEAAESAKQLDVDTLIADNDLSPAQERNIEKLSERKVVDRSQIIMDIFARRARTRQSKLQVELAQLRYNLPRLKRMWSHLSRHDGGIGMRGPGETQLETDKRLVRKRIQRLERDLEEIQARNEELQAKRSQDFVISLVGYTNSGKSTLLNRLTGADALVEDKLFATLDSRVRRWTVAPRRVVLLGDTVGFIRDLPHHLVASFQSTLSDARFADLLLHVVDASSPNVEAEIATVQQVLKEIDCGGKSTWVLLNKWDAVPEERRVEAQVLGTRFAPGTPVFCVSAVSGTGLDAVAAAVDEHLHARSVQLEARIPHSRGDLAAYLRKNGKVLREEFNEEGVLLVAELTPARAAKFRALWPDARPLSR